MQGFVVIRGLFSADEVARIKAAYTVLLEKAEEALAAAAAAGPLKLGKRRDDDVEARELRLEHEGVRCVEFVRRLWRAAPAAVLCCAKVCTPPAVTPAGGCCCEQVVPAALPLLDMPGGGEACCTIGG